MTKSSHEPRRTSPTSRWSRGRSEGSAGSARPLEDVSRIAHGDLIGWLADEHQMEKLDAYKLVTQISESPVANVCDPNYTFVAKARRLMFPAARRRSRAHA